jgi:hypothetical protein
LTDIVTGFTFDFSDISLSELSEHFPDEVNLFLAVFGEGLAERLDDCLALLGFFVNLVKDRTQMLVDVLLEHFGKAFGERTGSHILRVKVAVDLVILEVFILLVESLADFNLVVDVFLGAVFNSHVP